MKIVQARLDNLAGVREVECVIEDERRTRDDVPFEVYLQRSRNRLRTAILRFFRSSLSRTAEGV